MKSLNFFKRFTKNKNNNLSNIFLFILTLFIVSFINPLLIIASDEIKNKNNQLINQDSTSISLLQKDYYLIGNGDTFKLKIIGMSELDRDFSILNDGTSTIPLVGLTNISGMSIQEAKEHIEELLSKELINPKVELILSRARPVKISIIGEVFATRDL